jgi:MYXO-CTERM domain-containing protein
VSRGVHVRGKRYLRGRRRGSELRSLLRGSTPEIPDAKVFIEVGYHETFEGTGVDLDGSGCSASPGTATTGGAFAVLALLLSLASRRRQSAR